ncbi:alpha/beta fold hydrolase [Novipirellula artificiosorum]|uniref:Alpha/beta hydrolase family protein n=1 Tax=Novipirellula artificiosorum TaxID=2528016 RepID=A0A5C6CU05_9BACT|nr:alpha/beta hydrolase [Novipirellula artificiosorum]TWU27982.1 Alpha/beta hydrolase family protein [Novipirellula artificiosorum]
MHGNSTPLILFSGLAADREVFAPQSLAFENLIVPSWPVPESDDTLDSYSERLAGELGQFGPAVIGGASFGGIVALHVAKHLDPLAVILIGSVRSSDELPRSAKWSRRLQPLVSLLPVRLMQIACVPIGSKMVGRWFPHLGGLARQFRHSDSKVFKWSLSRILDWDSTPRVDCPIYHIHGDRDMVLPIRHISPTQIVAGGGHVISLTHANEVNAFIGSVLKRY